MQLLEVKSTRDSNRFITFPAILYKNEKAWIRPVDKEIENVFDPSRNNSYEHGYCQRWLLEHNKEVIGRIAAFITTKISPKGDIFSTGGIGFFECINDQNAANILFDISKDWLQKKGCDTMDGPINFGSRDKWWGLLTKGFDLEPNYGSNYNFPYYKELFKNYGFQTYFEHYTFVKKIDEPLHPRLHYKADIISNDDRYTFEHFNLKKFKEQTAEITEMYNKAWVNHSEVSLITKEQGELFMSKLKSVIDEKIIWLAYYDGKPVAFYINIPEVNQFLKHVNGKLDLFGKLKFLWYKRVKKNKKMMGLVFGVVPEHQGKGVDGAIILSCYNMLQRMSKKYELVEISGIGDFNRKMVLVVKQVGGEICKTHTTYRYQFDRQKPFERMKSIR